MLSQPALSSLAISKTRCTIEVDMTDILLDDLCGNINGGHLVKMRCEVLLNARPEHTAEQTIRRAETRLERVKLAGQQKHWSYDLNIVIALKELIEKLKTTLEGYKK